MQSKKMWKNAVAEQITSYEGLTLPVISEKINLKDMYDYIPLKFVQFYGNLTAE